MRFSNKMHTLIISNRHISNYFDLSKEEKDELPAILEELKNLLLKRDASIEVLILESILEKQLSKLSCISISI